MESDNAHRHGCLIGNERGKEPTPITPFVIAAPITRRHRLRIDRRWRSAESAGRKAGERSGCRWFACPRFAAIAALLLIAAAPGEQAHVRYVTDRDTFRLTSGERIRIAGIDAPETHADQARCRAELALGDAAATPARALFNRRDVTIVRVGRSYNRTVARVMLGGRDLAGLLVAAGVARWWPRGAPKPDWCGPAPDRRPVWRRAGRRG